MANNEERYCNVCKEVTLFTLQSDLLWYCDECDNVYESNCRLEDEEMDYLLYEFEEENGESVVCKSCNNFIVVEQILQDGMCPICQNDLDEELEQKGYTYNQEEYIYQK